MAIPLTDPLPVAPSRERPATFAPEGDAFFNAVEKKLQPQINASVAGMNETAAVVDSSSVAALIAAQNAAAAQVSASTLANAQPWVSGTTYALNAAAVSQANFQTYRKRTNSSVSNIDPASDSTNWALVGGPVLTRFTRTANTILDKSNTGNFIDITAGTFTQTFAAAATLGNGWVVRYRNSGTGVVTLDPSGAETIDGAATVELHPGWYGEIQCNGVSFMLLPIKQSTGYMKISDRKAAGTDGGSAGTANGVTLIRALNTVEVNTIIGASLLNNQVTLPAGIYQIKAHATAHGASHKAQWYNVTDSTVSIVGTPEVVSSNVGGNSRSALMSQITFATTKTFELRHYVHIVQLNSQNLGVQAFGSGQPEVYSEVEIIKVA